MARTAVGGFFCRWWMFLGALFAFCFTSSQAQPARHSSAARSGLVSLHIRDDNNDGQKKDGHSVSGSPKPSQDDASNDSKGSGGDTQPQGGNSAGSTGGKNPSDQDSSGKSGSSSSSPSSSSSSSSSPPSVPPFCQFTLCLDNGDPQLSYSAGWNITSKTQQHPLHLSNTPGSTVQLSFNSSFVVVFGFVPNGTQPLASFSIDGGPPYTPAVPVPDKSSVEPLFTNMSLDSSQEHSLVITVGNVSNPVSMDTPFFLSYISLSHPPKPPKSPKPSSKTETETKTKTEKNMIIVGSVLGSVLFLLLLGIALFFILRWRRRRKGLQRKWRRNFDVVSSSAAPTLTNTASIMFNRGPTPSLHYGRTDRGTSWAISEPPAVYPATRTSVLTTENMRTQRSSKTIWTGMDL